MSSVTSLFKKYFQTRSWSDFFDRNTFNTPTHASHWSSRSFDNLEHFVANYCIIFLGICFLLGGAWNISLLIVIAFTLGISLLLFMIDNVKISKYELSEKEKLIIVALVLVVGLIFTSSYGLFFSCFSVSFIFSLVHSSFKSRTYNQKKDR